MLRMGRGGRYLHGDDDKYQHDGGDEDGSNSENTDEDDSEEDMDPTDFEQQIQDEKKQLLQRSIRDFMIGFVVASAMFALFYGLVSIKPSEEAVVTN